MTTPVTGFNARTDLLNQFFFIASRDNVLNALKSQQNDVWYYQFDWDEEPAPLNDIYGAAHAFDLPFVFGNFGPSLFSNVIANTANRPGRLALSDAMMKSLGAFAQTATRTCVARRHLAGLAGQADLRRGVRRQHVVHPSSDRRGAHLRDPLDRLRADAAEGVPLA